MASDERLIQRMRKGDDAAIEEFVRKYYPMILAYCKKRLQDPDLAQDLTQETFEHFFRSLSLYRHHGKIKNYLYTIAGNVCRDFYKTAHAEFPAEFSIEEAEYHRKGLALKAQDNYLSYDPIAGIEEQMDMKNALDRLPEIYRKAVALHFLSGMKQTEIAEILNVRLHIVKYRIKKGKKLLQEVLKEGIL